MEWSQGKRLYLYLMKEQVLLKMVSSFEAYGESYSLTTNVLTT